MADDDSPEREILLNNITPQHIQWAVDEHNWLGREQFLAQYGFGPAQTYFLNHGGQRYDTKAIVGVGHQYVNGVTLGPQDFFGGAPVKKLLERLGFNVTVDNGNVVGRSGATRGWPCAPDAAHNAAVEAAAIAFVRSSLGDRLGEETRDRQKDNCGWDLEYMQAGRSLCVEVKGLSGAALGVELSPNEYAAMKRAMNKSFSEGQYRLAIVRNAPTAPELFLFARGSGTDWICELTSKHISVTERIAARLSEV